MLNIFMSKQTRHAQMKNCNSFLIFYKFFTENWLKFPKYCDSILFDDILILNFSYGKLVTYIVGCQGASQLEGSLLGVLPRV